jgi:hypothetical protein
MLGRLGAGQLLAAVRDFMPHCSDRLWYPSNILSYGYWDQNGRGVEFITHLQLVPSFRRREAVILLPRHQTLTVCVMTPCNSVPYPAAEASTFLRISADHPLN